MLGEKRLMSLLLIDDPLPGVRRLRINRPEARNAIDAAVRAALRAALADAANDSSVRVMLFGSANGIFCAGGDLPSMVGLTRAAAEERMRESHEVAAAIGTFPKPVVAAVERFAVGAGAGLALLADHLMLADNAVLGFPFLKIGLVPDWGITATLPLRAGSTMAARVLRTAANVSASEALAAGIVDELVPSGQIEQLSIDLAAALAVLPAGAFRRLKTRLRGRDFLKTLDDERAAQVSCLIGPEFAEGYAAFVAKRMPDFQGLDSKEASD
jgi:2-(1,2-epoxy-1,2-dihydrophenyl)acetyl-CoA isomerase